MIASHRSRCTPAGSLNARWSWIAVLLLAVASFAEVAAAQTVAWTARKNGTAVDGDAQPGSGSVIAGKRAMAVDGTGNVFVTGTAANGSSNDFLTVAYDPAGNVLWSKLRNGAANGADHAYALALGASGNVYVTGYSFNGSNSDFLTVAYDSAGNELWSKVKNGAANGSDSASALAVDGAENVYVTGGSHNGTNSDYLTVAYDSAGTELWATVRNGAANLDDSVYALAVTPSGTVFVTGYSNNATNSDYMTVAYDSAGAELWARVKNGAGNGADSAQALAADAAGNVFVTGYSFSGSTNDYLTVAYDISGNELWTRSKNLAWENAFAVALDSTGRVLVTGISSNGATHDYLTVSYDGLGNELWARLKNGAANKDDFPYALVADGSDNVFVTGYSNNGTNNDILTVAYDAAGTELWAKVRNGAANDADTAYAIGVRAGGGVCVTGYSHNGANNDYLTVAYDSAGNELWGAKEPPQFGYDDRPGAGDSFLGKRALAVDESGKVFVTGQSSNGTNNDYLTVAYDSSGNGLWARLKNGAANGQDAAYALAVDGSGNVYVTGLSSNGLNTDFLTVAYDSAGTELWAQVKNGAANSNDQAHALAVDGSGNVYVAGYVHNGATLDYLTVAYDSAGTELWSMVKNGAANNSDYATALAVDGSGNVYVTGYSPNGSNYDYLTVAYDSAGNELWSKVKNGATNNQDFALALAVDGSGRVYVTGYSFNGSNNDYLTVAYDSSGTELWSKVKNGATSGYDYATALAVNGSGNVYVTGYSSNGSNNDYLTVAYDSLGTELWSKEKNGAANSNDQAYGLAVDGSGNAYVTGQSSNGSNTDYLAVAYDSSGTEVWQYTFDGGGADYSYLAAASGNGLYVSGYSAGQQNDFFTVKLWLVADTTPPSDPSLGLTSPPESIWTNDNTVSLSWSGAVDEVDGSGIDGYSVEWNTTSVSTPDASVDVNHTADPHSTTSPPLADGGGNYFHLSTCDNSGNCTSTVHAGPFWIDTAPPSAPGAVSSASHGDGLPHADSTIDLSWGASTDALSGLGDYLYAFDNAPAGPCTGGGSTAGTSAASASLPDGIWYAHVCSTDQAGNSSAVHGGPYRIGADLAYASTLVSHQASSTAITGNGASSGRYLSADGRYAAFSSLASDLVVGGSDANGVQDAFLWDRVTNLVTLISHLPGLPESAASGEATATGISSDGSFVVFHSTAADMISGGSDTNGAMDAFLWERATGIVTLISHAAGLPTTAGDEISYTANGALSADGQRVAIYSNATNLVAGAIDVSATTDALMWDRATDLLAYVSHLPGSPTSAAASYSVPSFMSADGEFVAFYSQATNLMSGGSDVNGSYDVFLWERATGDVALVSHVAGSPGVAGSGLSSPRALSGDGEILVYLSYATDLVPGFSNNNGTLVDTFAYVRSSGESELLSRTTAGPGAGGNSASYGEAVSADGRYVLLTSASSDLVPGVTDPNGTGFDVFLRDRVAGATRLLTPAAGTPSVTSNNESVGAALSSDGRFALYKSWATDLIPGMTPANGAGEWDVYLVDTVLGDTDLLSHSASSDTTTANAECLPAGLASGGAVALMECVATDLAAGVTDPNGPATDLYVAAASAPDSTPPTDAVISSISSPTETWSTDNTVEVSWWGAFDEPGGSGLAGYSIAWDHAPLSTPDPTVDVAHGSDPHSTTSPALADAGDWYFHLRTCDIAGNCTSTVHAGPFWIDTVAPSQPGALDSASHGLAGIPASDVDLVVTWGAASDAGAGVDGYSYFVDGSPSASCDLTQDAEEGTTGVTFAGLSQGTWYVHVCAVDSAGNWGPVRTGGPFIVDSTAPASATTVYYSRYSSGDLRRVGANGLGDASVLGGLAAPIGLAIDTRAGKLYFSLAGSNQIARCDLDGTNLETLVTGAGGAYGLALDLDGGKVYWAARTAGAIRRANLDGTAVESVLTGLYQPLGVAFDRTWRKVYFTEDSFAPPAATVRIGRANPDGTNLEVLLTVPGTNRPYAIDVDPVGQVLYWVNTSTGTGTIRRLSYDGSGDAALVSGSAPGSVALEPVSQHLFWAEEGGQSVRRARTSGASAVTLSSGGSRWGVALRLPPTAPQALAQAISVPENGSTPLRLRAFDANNDALTWVQLADPLHGSLSGTAPDLVYTPTPGYFGSDSFTFEVGDGTLTSPLATVSITVTPVDDPPTAPAIGSVVPAAGTWTNDNTVQISWSGAQDDPGGSGLAGYSIEWNHLALSTPDSTVEIAQSSDPHSTLSPPLADAGDWYFHLRACDLGGNCSTAVHVGPIQIDTVMPENILSLATDPPTNLWSADNTFELTWSGATDDRSGVAGYSLFISQATGLPDETIEVVHASDPHHFVTVPLADGELWAFKVRTCDRAGNCRPGAVLTAFGRIDTQAPTSPGAVSSSSHDGGVTNDPTIDVAWGAASDAGSGIASYRIGFTTAPAPPSCGALPQTAGGTSASSPPLAVGSWYAHVCAVDAAGNESSSTTGGPYTIDLSAPRVSTIDSVATSGGAIGEGEVVNVAITQLLVSFDEPMVQALAEAPSSYQLVAPGIDEAIDTATCGPLQGDDQSVAIDSAVYAGQTSTLSLNGPTALAAGNYRLLVCAALEDLGGNPLDGDGNGSGGDDFSRSFRVDLARPTVTLVHSVADTGDGSLGENEATNVAITELAVSFSEAVLGGDSTASFLLVEGGLDGALDTTACGPLAGDDASVLLDSAVYASLGSTSTLTLNGGAALADGTYRLLVCGTVIDLGGNALDDDDDGDGNDDFARSFVVDTVPPTNPTSISSSTHVHAAWSPVTAFVAEWSGGTDNRSGPAGYSVVIDGNPTTAVDCTIEVSDSAGTGSTAATLGDGTWYVHVRLVDHAGNCAVGVAEDGFWGIDTSAPTAPGAITSASHDPTGTPVSDDTIDVAWGAASDTFSGVASYSYAFDGNPTGSCSGSSTASLGATSGALADGSHYVHVCAVDYAGNSGAAVHGGPYVVDTAGPTGLVVSSPSHSASTWSNDNGVDFVFSGATDTGGVAGYAIAFDQAAATVPVCATTQAASTFTGSSSADGSDWWIHVRARDAAGNCGDTVHLGPFWIDTAAPGAPGAVSSSSHDGGPTNDTTIDVAWGAAIDALSGIDGYSFYFNGVDDDCDGTVDSDDDERSAISPPLAAGTWYFHVCAVDLAGNWGAVTTGGPYTIDLSAPRVTSLDSVATSGGAIGEGEVVNVGITHFLVSFDEAMDATLADGVGNYLLVFGGLDGTVDTSACGPLQGDDQAIGLDSAAYAGQASTLALSGATALTDGHYRLLVCASLEDVAGNALDGDGNGSGGDDFARSFRVDLTPPTVALVNTVADTGDGVLSEVEPTNVVITELSVSFDEEVIGGDSLSNFLLVEGGLDGTLDTAACGPLAGDDTSLPIDAAVYSSLTTTLALNGGAALAEGEYRLLVCATLADLGGNALDGDEDGDGPDDFARTFTVDTVPPTNPTAVSSSTHILGAWSSVTGFAAEWSGATDDRSGPAGYSVVIDGSPTTAVDCTIEVADTAGTGSTAATLGEGAWYVHVRLVDRAGNCAAGEAEAGFWGIDTSAPGAPGAISSASHDPVSSPVSDTTIDVAWGPASDAVSSVASYRYAFDGSPTGSCLDGSTAGLAATSGALADGTWYLHVCAVDLAGNTGAAAHGGPWIVDTTPPAGLAVSSSSHTVATWSNDNSVDFSFSGATDANAVAGYAVVYDQASGSEPACATTQTGSTFTGSSSLDGNHWWIHVRARDTAGNCGATTHLGPFWIDTVAPGTVSGFVSTDHAPDLPSIDPTIAMTWTAATDDRSGVAGYSVQFNNCGGGIEVDGTIETAASSFASAALTHGPWCAHVYARDEAGNWGGLTSAGTYWIDLIAPRVTVVDSLPSSSSGELTEGETTGLLVTHLRVSFNEPMSTSASLASSFRLLADSGDGFQTGSCAGGISPQDQAFAIDAVTLLSSADYRLTVHGGVELPSGTYRLMACASLTDVAGNHLDGNGDTVANDDFVRSFTIDRSPPRVTLVETAAPTAGAGLDENEATNVAVSSFTVTFSEPVYDPIGDTNPDDVTNPGNYRLVESGGDGFQTVSCQMGVAPADVALTVDAASYDGPTRAATLAVNGGVALGEGTYRLYVCGSAAIIDLVGLPLDGDVNGLGGDDFVRTFQVDTTTPSNPVLTPNLPPGVWTNVHDLVVGWSGASDDASGSGLAGYSVHFDLASGTDPGTSVDVPEAAAHQAAATLADGAPHYFHLVTCDRAGNCAAPVETGPFQVDTQVPSTPTPVASSSHGDGLPHPSTAIAVSWAAAVDQPGLSGLSTYLVSLQSAAAPPVCGGTSTGTTSTALVATADGSYFAHVCAVDVAGNASSVAVGGPYVVDTAGPAGLVVSSSSHTVAAWSNDNTVGFSWSGATDPAGVAGYAVAYDLVGATEPACATTQTAATFTGSSSPDAGTWWIHVRAIDNAGNCGDTVHVGPFQIDTQSPAAPTGLASSSHDVGVASNDDTVDVEWVAAVDQPGLSGMDGYGFFFSIDEDDDCDAVMSVEEDVLVATSAALAEGDHYFHLCAVDNAGNWSPVAALGPFVIDLAPAAVVAVGTVADTGDGELGEGESTLGGVTQLLVRFDGAMFDGAGDSDPSDVTHPGNYRLFQAGANGAVETAACGSPAGDDVEIPVALVSYSAATTTAALAFSGTLALPRESYRLLVCPTLEDEAGSPIDLFARDFVLQATDLLSSPNLDSSLAGWVVTEPVPGALLWSSSADAGAAETSGAAELLTATGAGQTYAFSQCLDVPAGPYLARARTRIAGSSASAPAAAMRLDFFAAAACAGALVDSSLSSPVSGDTAGVWLPLDLRRATAPATALSVLVTVSIDGGTESSFTAALDDLFFGRAPELFSDGFESGDTSAWSASAP